MKSAGARKTAPVTYLPSLPGSPAGGGAATTGGSAVIPPALTRYFPFLYDAVAAASSFFAIPSASLGVFRKSWKRPHSPWPVVPPNDGGCSSDMADTSALAARVADAVARVIGSV